MHAKSSVTKRQRAPIERKFKKDIFTMKKLQEHNFRMAFTCSSVHTRLCYTTFRKYEKVETKEENLLTAEVDICMKFHFTKFTTTFAALVPWCLNI